MVRPKGGSMSKRKRWSLCCAWGTVRLPGVILALSCNTDVANAADCSPLYSLPAVKRVVTEHAERVFTARKRDPNLPYDVARNMDVLGERITKALRDDFVHNPA